MSQANPSPTMPPARPGEASPFPPPWPEDIRATWSQRNIPPVPPPEDDPLLPDESETGGPRDILIGEAGMHFVLARLLQWGVPAHPAGPGLPYDIIAEGGFALGLIRLQVKSTARPPRGRCYRFTLTRGFHGSARGVFAYQAGDFEIAAFVALPLDRVLFRAFGAPAFTATPAEFRAPDAERRSLRSALAIVRARWRQTPPAPPRPRP